MSDLEAKRMMLVMAASYEPLAEYILHLRRSGLPHEGAEADFRLSGLRGTSRSW
jgi:hypothetical protein